MQQRIQVHVSFHFALEIELEHISLRIGMRGQVCLLLFMVSV